PNPPRHRKDALSIDDCSRHRLRGDFDPERDHREILGLGALPIVRRQVLIAALTILAVIVVVSLTGSQRASADVPAAGGVYLEGVVGHPTYLNPLLSTLNNADEDVVSLVFSGLT